MERSYIKEMSCQVAGPCDRLVEQYKEKGRVHLIQISELKGLVGNALKQNRKCRLSSSLETKEIRFYIR